MTVHMERPTGVRCTDRANGIDDSCNFNYTRNWPTPQLPWRQFGGLKQAQIDWLLNHGVTPWSMIKPLPIRLACGAADKEGRFEICEDGPSWLAFEETEDLVFWQPRTGEIATWFGRAFALGESAIGDAATYSFDCRLNIYTDPLAWLVNQRDGIVVLRWEQAFDKLRDCPRIGVTEPLLATYRKHMRPSHWPDVSVLLNRRAA